jgi:hypothetical protein
VASLTSKLERVIQEKGFDLELMSGLVDLMGR